jgi:HSP20 family protein
MKDDMFKEMQKYFNPDEDFFGFFPPMRRRFGPPVDIYQTDKEIVVEMNAPGLDIESLDIAVEDDNILRIEGGKEEKKEEKGRDYVRREIRRGRFVRRVPLPTPVKGKDANAEYENGMLKITIPKAAVKEPKKIKIKVRQA